MQARQPWPRWHSARGRRLIASAAVAVAAGPAVHGAWMRGHWGRHALARYAFARPPWHPAPPRGGAVRLCATASEAASWPARKLRGFLQERGLPYADCFEKRELVERVQAALEASGSAQQQQPQPQQQQRPRPSPADAAQFSGFGELVRFDATDGAGDAAMIFLHGLGDSARGWASSLPSLLQLPTVRYVLPTAERLSFPGGGPGGGVNSWFDASVLGAMSGGGSAMSNVGPEVMRKSVAYCHHLIREELARSTPADRVFLGGFSQGGCVAVRAALSFPDAALGGCVAASTFLGDAARLPVAAANARLPVLCCHGEADQIVPTSAGQQLCASLREKGLAVEWRSYPGMGHASCPEEAADVRRFVQRRLVAQGGEQGLRGLTARQLKGLLRELGVDTSACYEKDDLLDRAKLSLLPR